MTARSITTLLLGLVCFVGIQSHGNSGNKPLKVRSIYPVGEEIATTDRITIEFNQNIVSLGGSMFVEDEVPIDIEPAVECEWNWVKLNTLQCELPIDSNLKGATHYKVTVRAGIKASNGQELAEDYVHSFATILPAISNARVVSWISPTQPIVFVDFNQNVAISSLRGRLVFYDSASDKTTPSRVWPLVEDLTYHLSRDFFGRKRQFESYGYLDERSTTDMRRDAVLILPQEPLPPGSQVSLLLRPGVAVTHGNLTTKESSVFDTEIATFDEFRLLGLMCHDAKGNSVLKTVKEPTDVACRSRSSFRLVFSSLFDDSDINDFVHTEPKFDRSEGQFHDRGFRVGRNEGFTYPIQIAFEPSTTYRLFVAPPTRDSDNSEVIPPVEDGFGRSLVGINEITFRTGFAAPVTFIDQSNIVVNSNGSFDPKFFLQNVEDVSINYDVFDENGVLRGQTRTFQRPQEDNVLQEYDLGLRSALRTPSGVMYGKIASKSRFEHSIDRISDYFFAQASPYSVFLKLGAVNSLAWVVDLQTGEPVSSTQVDFYSGTPNDLAEVSETIFSGRTNQDGLATLPGYETFDPHWDQTDDDIMWDCRDDRNCEMYFLKVEAAAGFALLPLDRNYVLNGFLGSIYGNLDHWAMTTQNLYMPGDTVQIKGYVRTQRDGIREIPKGGNFALCIFGPDEREYDIDSISLNEFGAYQTSLKLHESAGFGRYSIDLVYEPNKPITSACTHVWQEDPYVVQGAEFQVFEFKTNPIRVSVDLNATDFERGDNMAITTTAEFHAGGAYGNASGQVVVRLWPNDPPFETEQAQDYVFSTSYDDQFNEPVFDIELNDQGKSTAVVEALDADVYFGNFRIESSVMSDRGKSVSVRTSAVYYGVDEFVGIRRPTMYPSDWRYSERIRFNEPWPIQVMVMSKDDEIVVGKEVQIYVYASDEDDEYSMFEKHEIVFQCKVVSKTTSAACDFKPPAPIRYIVEARITDTKGHTQRSSIYIEAIVDESHPSIVVEPDSLELDCDSQDVDVGERVQCQVNNHVSTGPLLVTIERAGVVDQWIVRPNPKKPIVEFSVLDTYAPHFKLSVLAVSSRSPTRVSAEPKFQIAEQEFKTPNPRLIPLEIEVSSNRATFAPRDKVTLSISSKQQGERRVPIEYAIAVVDEALLDLSASGVEYYDPTLKSWKHRIYGLQTFGLIASLMEKPFTRSKTQTKDYLDSDMEEVISTGTYMPMSDPSGIAPDEQSDASIRKIDRFVAYWNPSVVSSKGLTKLDFQLPDNLTSWKVLVLAVSADDRFGFTTTTFATVKDTEVRAVAPNVVTEGDKFEIGASILNRSKRSRNMTVRLQATGPLTLDSDLEYQQRVKFAPFERKVISWHVEADDLPRPSNLRHTAKKFDIRVVASAESRGDKDALDFRIPVRSNQVRVSSVVYGALSEDTTNIPVEIPQKLIGKDGQLDFTLATNKAINFDGVFRYAIEYPYPCWEQKLTQAILAMQYLQLEHRGAKHGVEWPDAEDLITRVLNSASDFQVDYGGMAYFVARDGNDDPYLSAFTAIAFSWLEQAGYDVPQDVKQKLIEYLRDPVFGLTVPANINNDNDRTSNHHIKITVGAVVAHALAALGELTKEELFIYADYINQMDLFGLSQYLLASVKLDPTDSLNGEIFNRIMSHRSLVDGAVEFVESVPYRFVEILHSDTRSLCSVLESLTNLSSNSSIGIELGELNELSNAVRYARENLSHWSNTQNNVFCTNALITYFDHVDSDIEDLVATVDLQSNDTGISTQLADGWQFSSDVPRLHTQHSINAQLFGSHGAIEINRRGNGTAFYNVELSYLTTADEQINRFSGFEVHREYVALRNKQWQILEPGDHINKGEYVLVNLYLNNRFDRHHVVLNDSIPGGLEPVNLNLGTEFLPPYDRYELADILSTSALYKKFEKASYWRFRYRELGLQNARFYAGYLNRGKYHLMWLGQAISAGEFTVLPTHVEEMYRPIMFGKTEPWVLKIEPNKPAVVNSD